MWSKTRVWCIHGSMADVQSSTSESASKRSKTSWTLRLIRRVLHPCARQWSRTLALMKGSWLLAGSPKGEGDGVA